MNMQLGLLKIYSGVSLNDWALPLHIFAGKPFTRPRNVNDPVEQWVTQVVVSFLCFYVAVEI